MKIQKQLVIAVVTFIVAFNTLVPITFKSTNPYLKSIINSINNKSFIEASGQYGGATPFVTIAVEQYTQNHLPNITGTCSIGDTMNFTIKKGNTGVVSETFSKICNVSPYTVNPTITLPDGKYRVDVVISTTSGSGGD